MKEIAAAFNGPLTGKFEQWKKGKSAGNRFQCQWTDTNDETLSHDDYLDLKKYQQTYFAVQPSRVEPFYHVESERIVQLQADEVELQTSSTANEEYLVERENTIQVVFALTLEGILKKIVRDPVRNRSCIVEQFKPFRDGEKVHQLQLLKEMNALYASTDIGIVKIPLNVCEQYGTRQACLGTGDPYCGWNSEEEKCTILTNSPRWEQSRICAAEDRVIDGGWSEWNHWKPCSHVDSSEGEECLCRKRRCDSPSPMNGGMKCQGEDVSS